MKLERGSRGEDKLRENGTAGGAEKRTDTREEQSIEDLMTQETRSYSLSVAADPEGLEKRLLSAIRTLQRAGE